MQLRHSIFLLILFILALPACSRTEVEIPFETIQDIRDTGYYTSERADIMVITEPKQVEKTGNLIYIEDKEKLLNIDYSNQIGILLFHGRKAPGPFRIDVTRVTYDRRNIRIYSVFHKPGKDEFSNFEASSPYHIIRIEKPSGLENNQWTTFILYDEGQEVARHRVAVPESIEPSSIISPLSTSYENRDKKSEGLR